jgi:hypothetical protein
MTPEQEHEFYADPEHLGAAGPAAAVRGRPGLRQVTYSPPSAGPRTATVAASMAKRIIRLQP